MGKYGLPLMGPEKDLLLVGIMVPKLGERGSFLDVLGWLPFLKERKGKVGLSFCTPPFLIISSFQLSFSESLCLIAFVALTSSPRARDAHHPILQMEKSRPRKGNSLQGMMQTMQLGAARPGLGPRGSVCTMVSQTFPGSWLGPWLLAESYRSPAKAQLQRAEDEE